MTTRTNTRKKPKLTAKQIIKGGKLPQQTVPLCLRGDLLTAYQHAESELQAAIKPGGESLAGTSDEAVELAAKVDALRQEMQDYTLECVVQAMPRQEWKKLEAAHPPRRDEDGGVHEDDRRFGFDITTFFPIALPLSVVEPELDAEDWEQLLTVKLTDGQIENLCSVVWLLNQGQVSVPFSPAVSRILSSSGKK